MDGDCRSEHAWVPVQVGGVKHLNDDLPRHAEDACEGDEWSNDQALVSESDTLLSARTNVHRRRLRVPIASRPTSLRSEARLTFPGVEYLDQPFALLLDETWPNKASSELFHRWKRAHTRAGRTKH
jgi:hypothetical protein